MNFYFNNKEELEFFDDMLKLESSETNQGMGSENLEPLLVDFEGVKFNPLFCSLRFQEYMKQMRSFFIHEERKKQIKLIKLEEGKIENQLE